MLKRIIPLLLAVSLATPAVSQISFGRPAAAHTTPAARLVAAPKAVADAPAVNGSYQVRTHVHPVTTGAPAADFRQASVNDLQTQKLYQKRRNGSWIDTTRFLYPRYNAAGGLVERITDDINAAGAWARRNRLKIRYNAQAERFQDTVFSYLNNPIYTTRRTYTAGRLDSIISSLRFGTNWRQTRRDVNTYRSNGHIAEQLQQDRIGAWLNYAKIYYATDAQGRIVADESQLWDDNTSAFYPNDLIEYAYLPNDSLTTGTYSLWNDSTGAYEVAGRDRYVYSPVGKLDTIYNEPYANSSFGLRSLATYIYDAQGNRAEERFHVGSSVAALTVTGRNVFTFLPTGLSNDALTAAPLTLAPNPAADGRATLRYELKTAAPVAVEIVDLLGRRVGAPLASVTQPAGAHTLSLEVRHLPAGVYVVRLTAGAGARQVRLVVQ